jgi:hypothetical protein
MSDFLTEVDELMRQERMEALWRQYKVPFMAVIGGIILLTAVVSGLKSWNYHVRAEQTGIVLDLIAANDFPYNVQDNIDDLDLRPALKGMLLLRAAGEAMTQDKENVAVTFYDAVAQDKAIPDERRYPALIMLSRLSATQVYETEKTVPELLKPVLRDEKSPWHAHAVIEAAVYKAHEQQDFEAARADLNALQDLDGLPGSLYEKAQALGHVYALRQGALDQGEE